jgi:hypothetical protein
VLGSLFLEVLYVCRSSVLPGPNSFKPGFKDRLAQVKLIGKGPIRAQTLAFGIGGKASPILVVIEYSFRL